MNISLKGKNALVGGSSKGIGKAAAIELAALGANVTLVSRSPEIMSDIVHELDTSQGQHHDFLVADFSNREDLKKKAIALSTAKTIHILVNNTGGPRGGAIVNAELDEFLQAINNHLICNHILSQTFLKGMKKEGYGRIINVISTSVEQPIDGLGVSNTTRGAVANWAKTLATEVAQFGITVNNVLPGSTSTDRLSSIINSRAEKKGISSEEETEIWKNNIPAKRFAEPKEIGNAIAFLATPAAAYINGINLPVDGGRTKSL